MKIEENITVTLGRHQLGADEELGMRETSEEPDSIFKDKCLHMLKFELYT